MASRILEHPILGDRVTVLVAPEDSSGELLRIEYLARGVTPPPGDHVHPAQEERVQVLAGTVRCRVSGEERVLYPGDTLIVPTGTPHAVWNDDPAGSRSIGEFRPALDTLAALEAYFTAV
jgi:quercetin dioxygenase-like cupin family protein